MTARNFLTSWALFVFATGSFAAGYSASVTLGDGTTIGGSLPAGYENRYLVDNANGSLQGAGGAFAGFGQLSVGDLAVGNWYHNPPNVNDNGASSAMSSAAWTDRGTVTSKNYTGLADFNFTVNLSGLTTAAATSFGPSPATGAAGFSLKLQINDRTFQLSEGASVNAAGVSSFVDFVDGQDISPFSTFHFSTPITLGSPFVISAQLDGRAATTGIQGQFDVGRAFADGSLGMGYSFSVPTGLDAMTLSGRSQGSTPTDRMADQGFFWGGIDSVTQDGAAIPFAMSSESGTDWTVSQIPLASIPEPPIQALLALGLFAWRAVSWKRQGTV